MKDSDSQNPPKKPSEENILARLRLFLGSGVINSDDEVNRLEQEIIEGKRKANIIARERAEAEEAEKAEKAEKAATVARVKAELAKRRKEKGISYIKKSRPPKAAAEAPPPSTAIIEAANYTRIAPRPTGLLEIPQNGRLDWSDPSSMPRYLKMHMDYIASLEAAAEAPPPSTAIIAAAKSTHIAPKPTGLLEIPQNGRLDWSDPSSMTRYLKMHMDYIASLEAAAKLPPPIIVAPNSTPIAPKPLGLLEIPKIPDMPQSAPPQAAAEAPPPSAESSKLYNNDDFNAIINHLIIGRNKEKKGSYAFFDSNWSEQIKTGQQGAIYRAITNWKKSSDKPLYTIFNIAGVHWVSLVLIKKPNNEIIALYNDSLGAKVDNNLRAHISNTITTLFPECNFSFIDLELRVQEDGNSVDCGPYSIAFAETISKNIDIINATETGIIKNVLSVAMLDSLKKRNIKECRAIYGKARNSYEELLQKTGTKRKFEDDYVYDNDNEEDKQPQEHEKKFSLPSVEEMIIQIDKATENLKKYSPVLKKEGADKATEDLRLTQAVFEQLRDIFDADQATRSRGILEEYFSELSQGKELRTSVPDASSLVYSSLERRFTSLIGEKNIESSDSEDEDEIEDEAEEMETDQQHEESENADNLAMEVYQSDNFVAQEYQIALLQQYKIALAINDFSQNLERFLADEKKDKSFWNKIWLKKLSEKYLEEKEEKDDDYQYDGEIDDSETPRESARLRKPADKDFEATKELSGELIAAMLLAGIGIQTIKNIFNTAKSIVNFTSHDIHDLLQIFTFLDTRIAKSFLKMLNSIKCKEFKEFTERKYYDIKNFIKLLQFCIEKGEEKYPDLLEYISAMQIRKGFPDGIEEEAGLLFNLCHTSCESDLNLTLKLVRSISSMQSKRGLPDIDRTESLINLCFKKYNSNPKDALKLVRSISGMQSRLGLPDIDLAESFIDSCFKNSEDALKLASSISGQRRTKGLPDISELESLFGSHLKQGKPGSGPQEKLVDPKNTPSEYPKPSGSAEGWNYEPLSEKGIGYESPPKPSRQ